MTTTATFHAYFGYRDAVAALRWLEKAFGFEPKEVHKGDDGQIVHAQMSFDTGVFMISQAPTAGSGIYVAVDDPDAHHDRAAAAGAEITMELIDQPYGSREYGAKDLEGNAWYFGTYRP